MYKGYVEENIPNENENLEISNSDNIFYPDFSKMFRKDKGEIFYFFTGFNSLVKPCLRNLSFVSSLHSSSNQSSFSFFLPALNYVKVFNFIMKYIHNL
jgi:hypothetical protein